MDVAIGSCRGSSSGVERLAKSAIAFESGRGGGRRAHRVEHGDGVRRVSATGRLPGRCRATILVDEHERIHEVIAGLVAAVQHELVARRLQLERVLRLALRLDLARQVQLDALVDLDLTDARRHLQRAVRAVYGRRANTPLLLKAGSCCRCRCRWCRRHERSGRRTIVVVAAVVYCQVERRGDRRLRAMATQATRGRRRCVNVGRVGERVCIVFAAVVVDVDGAGGS